MTTVEAIEEILNSIPSCHPSREDDIKTRLCIEAIARRVDGIIDSVERIESKIYEADE